MAETIEPGRDGLREPGGQLEIHACDFSFRSPDEDGAMAKYDALFWFEDPSSGERYLVYADFEADESGDVGVYASTVVDFAEVGRAAAVYESGGAPKRPPVVALAPVGTPEGAAAVARAFELLDEEGDDLA